MHFDIESPSNSDDLLQSLRRHQSENYRLAAGFTDLLIELKKSVTEDLILINLSRLRGEGFSELEITGSECRIGALVTAAGICRNTDIRDHFPVLSHAAHGLASPQIREVATVGGNICQASPSGDLSCALVALAASCEIIDMDGRTRYEPLTTFFRGPGETSLRRGEVLKRVSIPVNRSGMIRSGFIKIGKRSAMECSIVSIGYHVQTDGDGIVTQAGLAIGAVAPTVVFCSDAAHFLSGRNINAFSEDDRIELARLMQQASSPIDDQRASAWYRREVLFNSAKTILE